jgi:hypothetical protein
MWEGARRLLAMVIWAVASTHSSAAMPWTGSRSTSASNGARSSISWV